jgi:hypothetical protein
VRVGHVVVWTSLLVLAVSLKVGAQPKLILQATCESPEGSDIHYGTGFWHLEEFEVQTSPAAYAGEPPIFIVDRAQPGIMRVMWGMAYDEEEPPGQRYVTFRADIVLDTPSQITAMHYHDQAIWMYSLYPKLGIAYISAHSHFPPGEASQSTAMVAACVFTHPVAARASELPMR